MFDQLERALIGAGRVGVAGFAHVGIVVAARVALEGADRCLAAAAAQQRERLVDRDRGQPREAARIERDVGSAQKDRPGVGASVLDQRGRRRDDLARDDAFELDGVDREELSDLLVAVRPALHVAPLWLVWAGARGRACVYSPGR